MRVASVLAVLAVLALASSPLAADTLRLAPYKDELFAYPKVLGADFGGDYIRVEFSQQRDVIDRDQIPDEKTRPEYVSLDVKASEADLVLQSGGLKVNYVGVGKAAGGARIVVIFIHGWQATRFDGVNDWRSGGNINRIKNLMVRNGGAYLSADYAALPWRSGRQIRALVADVAARSPGAPIFLACASLGSRICWDFLKDPAASARLGGVIFLAGIADADFPVASLVKRTRRIPILMSHGNRDNRVSWKAQERVFRAIKAAAPDYPVRLVVFDQGSHRSPLRMTDWRATLNWMLEAGGG